MITKTTANEILNAFFGKRQYCSLASTCYIGLSTSTPDSDGNNFNEPPKSAGYQRVFIGTYSQNNTQLMAPADDGSISNTNNIIFFPEVTSSWGTITHFGIFSSAADSKPLMWGTLTTTINVPSGYIPIFRAGALTVTLQ